MEKKKNLYELLNTPKNSNNSDIEMAYHYKSTERNSKVSPQEMPILRRRYEIAKKILTNKSKRYYYDNGDESAKNNLIETTIKNSLLIEQDNGVGKAIEAILLFFFALFVMLKMNGILNFSWICVFIPVYLCILPDLYFNIKFAKLEPYKQIEISGNEDSKEKDLKSKFNNNRKNQIYCRTFATICMTIINYLQLLLFSLYIADQESINFGLVFIPYGIRMVIKYINHIFKLGISINIEFVNKIHNFRKGSFREYFIDLQIVAITLKLAMNWDVSWLMIFIPSYIYYFIIDVICTINYSKSYNEDYNETKIEKIGLACISVLIYLLHFIFKVIVLVVIVKCITTDSISFNVKGILALILIVVYLLSITIYHGSTNLSNIIQDECNKIAGANEKKSDVIEATTASDETTTQLKSE